MTLLFHDVSHYQANYVPTGPTVAKATEGTGFTDAEYVQIRTRCAAKGFVFAGYHYLTPGNIAAQAAHALSVIGKSTGCMVDVERGTGGSPTLSDALAFIDAYRNLGGVVECAYVPRWYWSGVWGSPSLLGLATRGVKVVTSDYTTYSDSGPGWAPYGGLKASDIAWWQYTDKPIDGDAYKGTAAQLGELLFPSKPKPPAYVHPAGSRTLVLKSPPMNGHDVVVAQQKVTVHQDGLYGPDTTKAVERWQKAHHLVVDGKVGPKTWASMGVHVA